MLIKSVHRIPYFTFLLASVALFDVTAQQSQQLDGRDGRELLLRNFRPKSQLKTPQNLQNAAKFPVVDVHTHFRFKLRQSEQALDDFVRVMERASGLELDWYKEYWVNTTNTIDYAVVDITKGNKASKDSTVIKAEEGKYILSSGPVDKKGATIYLERQGRMPMPLDVVIHYKDGKTDKKMTYTIPLEIMRGHKPDEMLNGSQVVASDWKWTHPVYALQVPISLNDITKVEIDPSLRLADIDREDNTFEK